MKLNDLNLPNMSIIVYDVHLHEQNFYVLITNRSL